MESLKISQINDPQVFNIVIPNFWWEDSWTRRTNTIKYTIRLIQNIPSDTAATGLSGFLGETWQILCVASYYYTRLHCYILLQLITLYALSHFCIILYNTTWAAENND